MEPWECPRCSQINAPWVEKCDCPTLKPGYAESVRDTAERLTKMWEKEKERLHEKVLVVDDEGRPLEVKVLRGSESEAKRVC